MSTSGSDRKNTILPTRGSVFDSEDISANEWRLIGSAVDCVRVGEVLLGQSYQVIWPIISP